MKEFHREKGFLGSFLKNLNIARIIVASITAVSVFSISLKFFLSYSSDERLKLTGTTHLNKNGELYFISSALQFSNYHYFSSIYLEIKNSKNFVNVDSDTPKFTVDANLTCISEKTTKIINENLISVPTEFNELYTTWFPEYKQMILELLISGPTVNENTEVSLFIVRNTKEFATLADQINRTLCLVSLLTLLFYALYVLIFSKGNVSYLQFLSFLTLLSTIIANLSYNHKEGITELSNTSNWLYLISKGALSAINIFVLFCVSLMFTGTDNRSTTTLIGIVFIFAECVCDLTTDSYVLSELFDSNGLVWVFFFSSSMLTKISLICLSVKNIIHAITKSQTFNQKLYYSFYLLYAALLVVPAVIRALLMIQRGFQSSCVNFFCNYIAQATAAFLFVQLAWPVYSKEREDLADLGLLSDMSKQTPVKFEAP